MFSSVSSALLWRGILAIGIGIVSVAWPNVTVGAFVILFAIYAFLAAGSDVARAFSGDRAGPVAGYLFLALLSVAAGLIALVSIALGVVLAVRPGIGALSLATVFGLFSIVAGVSALVMSANARRMGTIAGPLAGSPI